MKSKLLTLGLIAGAAALLAGQAFAQEPLFKTNFSGEKPLDGWSSAAAAKVVKEGPDGNACLKFSIPLPEAGAALDKSAMISKKLDAAAFKGKNILVEAKMKADSLLEPPKPHLGAKLMIYFMAGEKKGWPDQKKKIGTYDWEPFSFTVALPENLEELTLILGIQSDAGTLWIDDVTITEVAK